jgi:hypothetical protein
MDTYGIEFALASQPTPLVEASAEALKMLAVLYRAVSCETQILPDPKDKKNAILEGAVHFKTESQYTRFKKAPFHGNYPNSTLTCIDLKSDRPVLEQIELALEALRELPQLRKEILILPLASEANDMVVFFAKNEHSVAGFVAMIKDLRRPVSGAPYTSFSQRQIKSILSL